jgi:uncharacterized protein (TIGR02118 family)
VSCIPIHGASDSTMSTTATSTLPLVKARMGESCKYYTVDKGLAGATPDAPATYVAMCHIFCDSVEAFQAGFGPHAKEIMADIPKYTDLSPVIQISEVVVG